MRRLCTVRGVGWVPLGFPLATLLGFGATVFAQPAPESVPPVPSVGVPPAPTPTPVRAADSTLAAPANSREAELENRIRQLEGMVQKLSGQFQKMQTAPAPGGGDAGAAAAGAGGGSTKGPTAGGANSGVAARTAPKASSGPLAPGQSSPPNPAPSARFNMPAPNRNDPVTAKFGPGFEFKTADEEYVLQFHNLTQIEFRGYQQGGQTPVHDTFGIPRQWFMFSGRITKPIEYFVSFQQPFDSIQPLDVFLNFHYDDRVQARIGRFKTPFTYEFYTLPIQGLIQPERSLFFNNFALNREVGAMLWGRVFNKTTDYAVGVFNQTQNGFLDTSDGKAFLGYLNVKPFANAKDTVLENLNVGGSVDVGDQFSTPGAPVPQTLRTAIATTGNQIIGVPFLTFNNNVRQAGQHTLWSLHAAYYYKQLSLISEWQSGFQDYALVNNLNARTHLPIDSYYVQAGYFLTGETASQRNVVKPIRPFDLRKGKFGPGAWELTGRYNFLGVSRAVFNNGLADPNLWSNSLYTTDVGFNWSWNQYVKVYFTWEHAVFGSPVNFAPGRSQLTSDLFLIRWQLFF